MAISIDDYLINHEQLNWSAILREWSWLVPSQFTLWMVNRFCDLFLVLPDNTVQMLDVGAGNLIQIAENRNDFCNRIDAGDNANDWLMIALVDELVTAGMRLQTGQCYGYKLSPVLGGEYSTENCVMLPIEDYLGACGSIHKQLQDITDGREVVLKTVNQPVGLTGATPAPSLR